jgi:hypothetical protein
MGNRGMKKKRWANSEGEADRRCHETLINQSDTSECPPLPTGPSSPPSVTLT